MLEGVKGLYTKGRLLLTSVLLGVTLCAGFLACKYIDNRSILQVLGVSDAGAGNLAIMQGVTTAHEIQIRVLTEEGANYRYSLIDIKGKIITPAKVVIDVLPGSERTMQRLFFESLTSNSQYLLRVHSDNGEKLVDERELKTLNPAQQNLHFAFTSCMLDFYAQQDIWEQMVMLDPDVIFLIGDNVYADKGKDLAAPADLWQRNIDTRQAIKLFRNKKLIPVVATWDDHDYGMNNAGRGYPYKEESLIVFKTFFASDETTNYKMPGIGVASHFSIYGYDFFLLDNRTFRTLDQTQTEAHFGSQQTRWLFNNLQGVEHAFIISGDQFFGGYSPKDSFQGHHPTRFAEFLDNLMKVDGEVVFLSGDRHFTEIMRIPEETLGYTTYEFTASPMHAFTNPFVHPNPLRIEGKDLTINFMSIKVNEVNGGLRLHATSRTVRGQKLFRGEYIVARDRSE